MGRIRLRGLWRSRFGPPAAGRSHIGVHQKTEDKVKRALNRLSEGKTTLIVAHRLSAITHVDWIYVLDAGRVVEQGTHADLLAQEGLYAGMYGAQKQSYG